MTVVRNLLVCLAAGAVAVLAPLVGCGREADAPDRLVTANQVPRAERLDLPPLPDWAPKDPSPEFLRAARVLKPMPMEILLEDAEGDAARTATSTRAVRTWPATYEFFGTLTDEQIERFRSTKVIRVPTRSLSEAQRAALDNWFEAFREAMRGAPTEDRDFLVILYKCGANEDFSNVEVGFDTHGESRVVHIKFWITHPDGNVIAPCNAFAVI